MMKDQQPFDEIILSKEELNALKIVAKHAIQVENHNHSVFMRLANYDFVEIRDEPNATKKTGRMIEQAVYITNRGRSYLAWMTTSGKMSVANSGGMSGLQGFPAS